MSNVRRSIIVAGVLLVASLTTPRAQARMAFGSDDSLHTIQQTKDPEWTLGFKTHIYFFGAGVFVKDDGYILQKKGETNKYYTLDETKIRALQADGTLPNPLPNYSIPVWDYIFGYSDWIIVGVIVLISVIKKVSGKAKAAKAAEAPPAT